MYYNPYFRNTEQKHTIQNKIKVIGEGKVSIQPDIAEVTIGIVTEETSLEQAQQKNAFAVSEIKDALIALGINEEDIQTIDYSIFPQYDYIDGKQIFRHYRVEHSLRVTVRQIQSVGLIVDTAVKNGANQISNIQFSVSDESRYVKQALTLAIHDAGQKAETIANTLNISLYSTPISVTEHPQEQEGPIPFAATLAKSEASTPIQPGTIHMTSTITAIYTY